MSDDRIALGKRGEALAADCLRRSGFRILGRNVRFPAGEIDIVARDGKTICFVEIKARRSLGFGFPEEAVTFHKQRRLRRLAEWYLLSRRLADAPVRFDVVSILLDQNGAPSRTRLIKGAFDAST